MKTNMVLGNGSSDNYASSVKFSAFAEMNSARLTNATRLHPAPGRVMFYQNQSELVITTDFGYKVTHRL